jgi:Putative Actinobacterial Holin-X, holin superfamily III
VNLVEAEPLGESATGSARGLDARLRPLLDLELELALTEARAILIRAGVAATVGAVAAAGLPTALALLLAAALASMFATPWQHLAVAGMVMLLASCATIVWATWSLRRLRVPREALTSIRERGQWLVTELKSRPISRLFGH